MMIWRLVAILGALVQAAPAPAVTMPAGPLKFGVFTAGFDPAGTFKIEGDRWPTLSGTWTLEGRDVTLVIPPCNTPEKVIATPGAGDTVTGSVGFAGAGVLTTRI